MTYGLIPCFMDGRPCVSTQFDCKRPFRCLRLFARSRIETIVMAASLYRKEVSTWDTRESLQEHLHKEYARHSEGRRWGHECLRFLSAPEFDPIPKGGKSLMRR